MYASAMKGKSLCLVAAPEHVESLVQFLTNIDRTGEIRPEIVTLDVEAEYLLEKKGIPFVSGKVAASDRQLPLEKVEAYVQDCVRSEARTSLVYRGISLGKIFAMSFQVYLSELLYYATMVSHVLEKYPACEVLYTFAPHVSSESEGTLSHSQSRCLADYAVHAAETKGIRYEVVPILRSTQRKAVLKEYFFSLQRILFHSAIAVINQTIRLCVRKRPLRILASELWKNIQPVFAAMPDAELFLLDRAEVRRIGLRAAWKHRMQFVHIDQFQFGSSDAATTAAFRENYMKLVHALPSANNIDPGVLDIFKATLERVCDRDVADALRDIDHAFAMLKDIRPDVVLLRATASRQPHFSILALVAEQCGVSAVELQHGIEHMGPGSLSRLNHSAKYTAVYGSLIRNEMIRNGYPSDSIVPVGSPRFDGYVRFQKKPHTGFSILCIAPSIIFHAQYDTYETIEYFKHVADAARAIPGASVVIKIKPGISYVSFYEEAVRRVFVGVPYEFVEEQPLSSLFAHIDVLISCHSTAIIEAMQSEIPAILAVFSPQEQAIMESHYPLHMSEGALLVARSGDELKANVLMLSKSSERDRRAHDAQAFLARHFMFDGRGGERTVELLRNLAAAPQAHRIRGVHIIVQARINSTRLPGKILKPFAGEYTFLEWLVERLRTSRVAEKVIVATSTTTSDDVIEQLCKRRGYEYARGSEEDVLSRYWKTAQQFNSKIVVRATSDNPFIDIAEMDRMVRTLINERLDYANSHASGLPIGTGAECCTVEALQHAHEAAHDAFDREHVTPYLRNHPDLFRQKNIRALSVPPFTTSIRLTLDTPEDYDFLTSLGRGLGLVDTGHQPSTTEVLEYLSNHPELLAINKNVIQKTFPGKI